MSVDSAIALRVVALAALMLIGAVCGGSRDIREAGTESLSPPASQCRASALAEIPVVRVPADAAVNDVITHIKAESQNAPVHLDLSNQQRSDEFVIALANASALADVRELNLAGNQLGAAAMEAVATSQALTCLQRLDMSDNPLSDAGFALLCESDKLTQLGELVLDRTGISSAALARIPVCTWRSPLRHLSVQGNQFSDTAPSAPLLSPPANAAQKATTLEFLDLSRSRCRVPCLTVLRDTGLLSGLRTLRIEGMFGPAEASILANSGMSQLTTLTLYGMFDLSERPEDVLGDEGLSILLTSQTLSRVERLELPLHNIGDQAVALMATPDRMMAITHLNLRGNEIHNAGAQSLMAGPVTSKLTKLVLAGNRLSAETASALKSHYGERVDVSR